MYNIRRNWKKWIVIYNAVAVVAYGAIYVVFFSGLFGGHGGGSSRLGY